MEQAHLSRKESLERIQSPEQLNDYLRVTNPSVWVLLTAVVLLLVGLLVWGSFTYIDSVVTGQAQQEDGILTIRLEDSQLARNVEVGMRVSVGSADAEISCIGEDEEGLFALAEIDLPDGSYEAVVHYKQTQILQLLFQ